MLFFESKRSILLLFFLSVLLQFPLNACYSLIDYQIMDLEMNNISFTNDTVAWSHPQVLTPDTKIYTQCNSTYLLGGHRVFAYYGRSTPEGHYLRRIYTNLPSHSRINFSFELWLIYTWDFDDKIDVILDSVQFLGWTPGFLEYYRRTWCDMGYDCVGPINISGSVSHTSSSLNFSVISRADQESTDESLAIRNVRLLFVKNSSLTTNKICENSPPLVTFQQYPCECPYGQYSNGGATCLSCNESCASCFGPTAEECLKCKEGYLFDGIRCADCYALCATCNGTAANECLSCKPGYSLFKNHMCVSSFDCLPPFTRSADNTSCQSPCSADQYVYWDGICSKTCISPYRAEILSDALKYCHHPCELGKYLYWNNSCLDGCPSPLASKTRGERLFCSLPCPTDKYYLYWSGSCLSMCNTPLVQNELLPVRLCDYPCLESEYLYFNGTCSDTCSPFYIQKKVEGKNLCNSPCPLEQFFLKDNMTCLNNCPVGFFANNLTKFCQECDDSLCSKCPPHPVRKCLECKQGAILDVLYVCKKCEAFKMVYVKTLIKGHQYRLKLFPTLCDLDPSIIVNYLKVSNKELEKFPAYSFEVKKHNKNNYIVDLLLQQSLFEERNTDVSILYLNGTMWVPNKIVQDLNVEDLTRWATTKIALASIIGGSILGTFALGTMTALWSLISFQQFVGYFIYINVEYPYQAYLFLSLFQSISWDMLPNPLASLTSTWSQEILSQEAELADKYLPPKKFKDQEVTSFFIENGGSIIVTNLLLLVLLMICCFLIKIAHFKKYAILHSIINKLRWNVIARTFLENAIPLSLAIFLQLRSFSLGTQFYMTLCTLFALLSLTYLTVMILSLTRIVVKKENNELEAIPIRKLYGTLWEGMILENTYGKYYHLIILYRGVLLIFLVVFFENFPLLQSSLMILFNAGLIYFLFTKASFADKKLNIINRIKEILILIGEICILLLQFLVWSVDYYELIAWLMVGSLATALVIELGYIIYIQTFEIKSLFQKMIYVYRIIRQYLKSKSSRFPSARRINLRTYLRNINN